MAWEAGPTGITVVHKGSINMKIGGLFALITIALVVLQICHAGEIKELRFNHGSTTAVVEGEFLLGERNFYYLTAKAGQTMEVSIDSIEKNAVFAVYKPGYKVASGKITGASFKGACETDDATSWTGALPASGRYLIAVGGTRGNADYKLKVIISALSPPPKTSSRLRNLRYVNSERVPDPRLEEALLRNIGDLDSTIPDVKHTSYRYNKVDLNNDGIPELIVYATGYEVCGSGGCSAYIFSSDKGKYILLASFSVCAAPIIVSANKTRGWHDIIVYHSGGAVSKGNYYVNKFNGSEYPDTRETTAKVDLGKIRGVAYVADSDTYPGIELKSPKNR